MSERNHDSSNAPQPGRRGLPAQQHSPAEASSDAPQPFRQDCDTPQPQENVADWVAVVKQVAHAICRARTLGPHVDHECCRFYEDHAEVALDKLSEMGLVNAL